MATTYGIRVYGSGTYEFNTEISILNPPGENSAKYQNYYAKVATTELYTENYLVLGRNIVEYNGRIWFNFESTVRLNDILTLNSIYMMYASEHDVGPLIITDPYRTLTNTVIATTSSIPVNGVNISGNWAVIAWTGGVSHPSGSAGIGTANSNYLDEIKFVNRPFFYFMGNYNSDYYTSSNYIFSMVSNVTPGFTHYSTNFYTYIKTGYKATLIQNNAVPGKVLGTVANSVISPYVFDFTNTFLPEKNTYDLVWSNNDFYLKNTSIGKLDQYDYLHASPDGAWLYNIGSTSDVAQLNNSVYINGVVYGGAVSTYVGNYVTYDNVGITFQTAPGTNISAGTQYYIRDSTHEFIMCSTTNNNFWALKYKISATRGGTPIVLQGYRTSTSRVRTYSYSFYSSGYIPPNQTRIYRILDTTYIIRAKLSLNHAFILLVHNNLYGGIPLTSNPTKDINYPSALKKAVSTRPQIIKAFLDNTSANLIPSEAEITYWKSRDLGTANNIFNTAITSYNQANYSQYNSNVAVRTAWANIQCPFTENQIANLNGSPSQAVTTGYTMLLLNSNDTNNKIQDSSSYEATLSYSGTLPVNSQTDLTYLGTMQLGNNRYYSATSNNNVITSVPLTYNFTIEFMIKPDSVVAVIINAPNYYIYYSGGYIYFVAGGITVQIGQVNQSQWNHVAIVAIPIIDPNNNNNNNPVQYIQGYTNGIRRISSNAITIPPSLAFGYMQFGGPTSGWGSQFSGYLAQVRIVWGISVYNNTSSFTVSTSKPLWSRVSTVSSFVELPEAPIVKEYLNYFSNKPKSTIEYWMQRGGDKNLTTIYDTTNVTWNLIDRFTIPAGHTIQKSYPQFSTREFQVTQLVVGGSYVMAGISGLNNSPIINTITKYVPSGAVSDNYSFQFSGSNVVTSIIIFVR